VVIAFAVEIADNLLEIAAWQLVEIVVVVADILDMLNNS